LVKQSCSLFYLILYFSFLFLPILPAFLHSVIISSFPSPLSEFHSRIFCTSSILGALSVHLVTENLLVYTWQALIPTISACPCLQRLCPWGGQTSTVHCAPNNMDLEANRRRACMSVLSRHMNSSSLHEQQASAGSRTYSRRAVKRLCVCVCVCVCAGLIMGSQDPQTTSRVYVQSHWPL